MFLTFSQWVETTLIHNVIGLLKCTTFSSLQGSNRGFTIVERVLYIFFLSDGLVKKLEELEQNANIYKGKKLHVFFNLDLKAFP